MHDTPYVGLTPFTDEDAPRFFGRDQEKKIIAANLRASRLTLLYGASGVGKSSVLRAGVVYYLRQFSKQNLQERGTPGFVVVYFNSWREDPVLNLSLRITQAISPLLNDDAQEPRAALTELVQTLQLSSERANATLLIILDQFEEYFLYHPAGEERFEEEFARAVNQPDLRVNFLVSIREDAVAKLDRFKGRIPNILGNYLRIEHLDRVQARAAIEKPLTWYNKQPGTDGNAVSIEPSLTDAVLQQVETGQVVLGESGQGTLREDTTGSAQTRIETPYLQLVMTRLWEEDSDSHVLRLDTLTRLGGAKEIVETHLDKAMSALSPDEQKVAASIFHYLVTPSGSKIAQTLRDLSAYSSIPPEQLAPLLEKLSREARILRPVESPAERPTDPRYQIFHDVLGPAVLDWRARYVRVQALSEADARAQEERKRAEQQANAARRLRWLSAALLLAFALAAGLALYGWRQHTRADQQSHLGLARQLAAQAITTSEDEMDLALLLSSEANRISNSPEVKGSLFATLSSSPYLTAFLQYGHSDAVRSVAFSPDGNTLASASVDNTIILWDVPGRIPIGSPLKGHDQWVSSVAFSPDGKTLASGSADRTVILWNVDTGEIRRPPLRQNAIVSCVAFSRDGKTLAWSALDGTVSLWDLTTDKLIRTLVHNQKASVYTFAFSSDGALLASGGSDNRVALWDVKTGRMLGATVDGHTDEVYQVEFRPDGKILASAGKDKSIILWDVPTLKPHGPRLQGHLDRVFGLAFSPDGKILASGSTDKSIILWDVDTGKRRYRPALSGNSQGIFSLAFTPKTDGATLASGNADGTVTLWDIPPTKWLGRPFHKEHQALSWVGSVAFTPDGKILASGGAELVLWDVSAGKPLDPQRIGKATGVMSVALSRDGKILASAAQNVINLWDVNTGMASGRPLVSQTGNIDCVALNPNASMLASGGVDNSVILWDLRSGSHETLPVEHDSRVTSVAFSPDGKVLASGGWDSTIVLWDVINHRVLRKLPQNDAIYSLAFNPKGDMLASASGSMITLWDFASGRWLGPQLAKHKANVRSLAFSLDGTMLASGSEDKTIIVWDVASGLPLGSPLKEQNATVYGLAFSPDGKSLASGSAMAENNWPLVVWDLDYESWQTKACDVSNRTLSESEWKRYFPNQSYHIICPIGAVREADSYALRGDTPKARSAFTQVLDGGLHSKDPNVNNSICWFGALDGFAKLVFPACDRAVALATAANEAQIRDSRGVAHVMTGDYRGAIQDFRRFAELSQKNADLQAQRVTREAWIKELEIGHNPIDDATRRKLRRE